MIADVSNLPDEHAVALVLNGSTVAVLMATPQHYEDFLRGFCLTEGIISQPDEVRDIEVVRHVVGTEVRGRIDVEREMEINARRRASVGPVGCGLCGIESLQSAAGFSGKLVRRTTELGRHARKALDELHGEQVLRKAARALHAAGLFDAQGLIAMREDVGRHNALDKLVGALDVKARENIGILLTSRISIDLVQKCARVDLPAIFSVSRPTRGAAELAQRCGMTLCLITPDNLVYYSKPELRTS
ncbi:formate dehydrogenase accessory sulfurtransferase FdhD [Celeribacter sp.]|uniref:formate dehydrogenase accessory sulfurtransferase FdhD n=1 Tax=Celeribacter sp. TaxID=1890673 RepID=UPI003A90AA1B